MTDAELNLLEHFAKSQDDTITVELIAELRQAKTERDWLVKNMHMIDCPRCRKKESCAKQSDCETCWLQAAKEATCQKN